MLSTILLTIFLTILLTILVTILLTNYLTSILSYKLCFILWGAQLLREPTVSIGHLKDRICIWQPAARTRGSAWTSWLSPVIRTTKTGIFVWFSGRFVGFNGIFMKL
jgi:hypothetical protein